MLFSHLIPDVVLTRYTDVTPALLRERGLCALLCDIDNTLAPYEQAEPDEALLAWLNALGQAGIRVALISNNDRARVEQFNRELRLPAFPKSGKPSGRVVRRVLREWGVRPNQAAMLGDQLLTDAYAGKHVGLTTIIVPPIRDKKTLFVRTKRLLERPFLRAYARRAKKNEEKEAGR